MDTISIITPWHNGEDLIPNYERAVCDADQIILIDNASDAATGTALQAMARRHNAMLLANAENTGFAAANNQGLQQATGDIVVFVNSDIVLNNATSADWMAAIRSDVQVFDGQRALCGPSVQRQLLYGMWLPYIEGWCIAGRRADFEQLGGWDTDAYPIPYWEDNDLCLRALLQDIGLRQTRWPIQHLGGKTAGALIKWGYSFETNRATFARRVREYWLLQVAHV